MSLVSKAGPAVERNRSRMSVVSKAETKGATDAGAVVARGARLRRGLSFNNIGAVYVWAIIIVVFGVWEPKTFLAEATFNQVVNTSAITALIALALIVPLSAGEFDLSVAYVASLSGVTAAHFLAHGFSVFFAVVLGLIAALIVGVMNAIVVVGMRVDSFIGTLATGSLVLASIQMITNGVPIVDPRLSGSFAKLGQAALHGVTIPVLYATVVAILLWILLDHTVTGRRLYATGFNANSARLAGVRTARLRFGSLICSALIAGIAGIALAATIGSGDPTAGPSYLLPAFAAAFLGATQLRAGRFNAGGTIIAILMLETGSIGLGLAAAPTWAPDLFVGVVLIAALAITKRERDAFRRQRRLLAWLLPGRKQAADN